MKIKKKDFLEAIIWFQSSIRPLSIYVKWTRIDLTTITQDKKNNVLANIKYRLKSFKDSDDILDYYIWCCTFKALEDKVLKRYNTYIKWFSNYKPSYTQRQTNDLIFYCFLLMVFRDCNQRNFISWERL